MSDRSWFYAANGQQQGPFPEVQLRDLINQGTVRADTLVWSEGMAGWQQAGEIPGLVPGDSGPTTLSRPGGPPPMAVGSASYDSAGLSIDLPLWSLLGRLLLLIVGYLLVIPAPWTGTGFYRWMASRMSVPGRPNFAFTGQPGDIWYVFIATALLNYVGVYDNTLQLIAIPVSAVLSWMLVRWLASHLASNGQLLPIAFDGSVVTFVGWQLLMYASFFTIIGWAWVVTAWTRWICRNISGTRREVIFKATGLEVLWRTLVFAIACAFIIPIPWMMRWYNGWYVSQFALVERNA